MLMRDTAQDAECCWECGYPFDRHDPCYVDGDAAVFCSKQCWIDHVTDTKEDQS